MAVKNHVRMSMIGSLPGNEMFSFGIALGRSSLPDLSVLLEPNDTVWNDLRDDAVEFFSNSGLSNRARLLRIKFAPIGTDGRYTGPAVEREADSVNNGVPGSNALNQVPNQIALAVTLHTTADLGRVKGRFYLPCPSAPVQADGRIEESWRDTVETAAATFITNVNNQPGLDVLDLKAVVASSGRRNEDGSVRIGPENHPVTAVSVGRTLDTIRRRRNKLSEFRGTVTTVS